MKFFSFEELLEFDIKNNHTRVEREFKTPLGIVRCGFIYGEMVNSIEIKKYKNGHAEIFKSNGHKIELISFKIKLPLYNGADLTDSSCWIFRIEKINDLDEIIKTYCLIDKDNNEVEFSSATGECLDAIEAYNEDWSLHIGTEDGEVLNGRAESDDWFPKRLSSILSSQSITQMMRNGHLTPIPKLKSGEKIHIQYLTAYNEAYNENISSWLAVDVDKEDLEEWIGID